MQDRHVADRVADMRKDLMIMFLDRGLAFPRAVHDYLPGQPVKNAQSKEHDRKPHIHRQSRRHEQNKRHRRRKMRAHEFQPQAEQGFGGA